MAMADRSRGLLCKVSCRSGTPYVLITELQANGNGGHVTWPPPQSEFRKRNTLYVFRIEAAANGNGGKITRPAPQSELREAERHMYHNGEWKWWTCHAASSPKWVAEVERVFITEVQLADSTVGVNEGSPEHHEVIQGLIFSSGHRGRRNAIAFELPICMH